MTSHKQPGKEEFQKTADPSATDEKSTFPATLTNQPHKAQNAHQTPSLSSIEHNTPDWSQYTLRKLPWRQHVTDFAHIATAKYRGQGTPEDPFIIQWLDHDPENPQSYSNLFKWMLTFLLAFMTLCVTLASSAYTGTAELIIERFHCSREVFLLGLSLYVLGWAVGPLFWAPLCEAIARREVLLISLVIYTIFTASCAAAQNIETLIVLRLLCSLSGAGVFVVPGGQISDMVSLCTANAGGSKF
jgi:hypothetical protein